MKFTKMHGLGNDYVCINGFHERISMPEEMAIKFCDRHYGIGADGMLLILPSETADFKMELYNADGSNAKMCGNGIRCLGKYVFEHGLTKAHDLSVETRSGIRCIFLNEISGEVQSIKVDMGIPVLNAHKIPIRSEKDIVIQEPIQVCQREFKMTGVSMGNPHVVVFVDELEHLPMEQWGIGFEFHPSFPDRTNIEFCKVISDNVLKVRVWERGVGETFACGTGACAAVVASVLNGFTGRKVCVNLPGGNLEVEWNSETQHIFLTGDVRTVFEGVINETI